MRTLSSYFPLKIAKNILPSCHAVAIAAIAVVGWCWLQVVETESLSLLFTCKNPAGQLFTGAAWNPHLRALFLVDEAGCARS